MTMLGAEVIIYPTAIGSEPAYPGTDSKPHWQQTMQGHEADGKDEIDFYGASFIADHHGQKVVETSSDQQEIQLAKFNLDEIANERLTWGVFRTRREDLYGSLSEPAPTSLLKKM
jgi:N-carbamoylputrescine amidase